MKLSIIIPAYNIQDYISECLYSLLPQMSDDCEVIIIDDCSTDSTVKMIRYCIMMHPTKNITLLVNPVNKGVSYSRNEGLKHCKGKYVAFVDGDDYVTKVYIRELLKYTSANLDYFQLSWKKIGGDGKEFYSQSLPSWNCSVWSRVFKKDIITHLFDESMNWAEDAKFISDNIKSGMKMDYVDPIVYMYRWGRSGSITSEKLGRV
jgi:glycosyltransferase involved in cell wall biosynthesis